MQNKGKIKKGTVQADPNQVKKIFELVSELQDKFVIPCAERGEDQGVIDGAILEYFLRVQAIHMVGASNPNQAASQMVSGIVTRLNVLILEEQMRQAKENENRA
jgi:hypothetical protein